MKHQAMVTRVVQEAPHIVTLFFTVNGAPLPFVAGQYITVYFEETGYAPGKAYSLSSIPSDDEMSITVKNVGEFSGRLCALHAGDTFEISSPYGFFNVNDDLPIVAIAAGVGLAPIWSIIRSEVEKNPLRRVSLFHTAPTQDELILKKDVISLFVRCEAAAVQYFVTREATPLGDAEAVPVMLRRMAIATDIPADALTTSRFYVCGSQAFVRAMWVQLMEAGVDEQRVVTETFFESSV